MLIIILMVFVIVNIPTIIAFRAYLEANAAWAAVAASKKRVKLMGDYSIYERGPVEKPQTKMEAFWESEDEARRG